MKAICMLKSGQIFLAIGAAGLYNRHSTVNDKTDRTMVFDY